MLSALFVAFATFFVATTAFELRRKLYSSTVSNWFVVTWYSDMNCKFPVFTESYASVCRQNGPSSSSWTKYSEKNGNFTSVEYYFDDPFCEKYSHQDGPYVDPSMKCQNAWGPNPGVVNAGAFKTESVDIISGKALSVNANPQFFTMKISNSPDIPFTGPYKAMYLDSECKNLIYKKTLNANACILETDKFGVDCYTKIGCNYTSTKLDDNFDCSKTGFANLQCSIKYTSEPTTSPTSEPTVVPTRFPTSEPSVRPSGPTSEPSALPTNPTSEPSAAPTYGPKCEKHGYVYVPYQLSKFDSDEDYIPDNEFYLSGCDGSGIATSSPSSSPVIAAIADLVVVEVSSASASISIDSKPSSSLTSATVAGIVVGGIATFVLLFAFMFYYLRQGKGNQNAKEQI